MIKAIFFDIDGTLMSHQSHSIPTSTKKALKLLKENHILTFIATGRHISELSDLPMDDLSFDGYITLNGQYCFNEKETIYDLPIDKEDIKILLNELDFPCLFVEKEIMYMNYHNETVKMIQESISSPLPSLNDINRVLNQPIYQIGPFDIDALRQEELLKKMPHCKKTNWHDLAIDIIPINGGKENGIRKVLEYYHIDLSETMAFGDGNNDIDMLNLCHIGIAMGNANDYVKSQADDICDDVDHDGIYKALKKYELI